MFSNLRAEMARKHITGIELAEILGINNSTFSLKFNGKNEFSLGEAFAIKKALGTDLSIEALFEPDEA